MVIRLYQNALKRRPFITQVATTAFLFGAGDKLAQHTVEGRPLAKTDNIRTGRMVLYGGAVFGPAATKWYVLLNKHINYSTKAKTVVARVAADQLIFTPINLGLFLSSMAFMEGWPPTASRGTAESALAKRTPAKQRVEKRLKDAYVTGVTYNYAVWPWVQLANFSMVPLEHRVLVVNIVALGWNTFLSYLNSR